MLKWDDVMGDPSGQEVFRIVSFENSRLVLEAANGHRLDLTRGAGDIEPWVQVDLEKLKRDTPVHTIE